MDGRSAQSTENAPCGSAFRLPMISPMILTSIYTFKNHGTFLGSFEDIFHYLVDEVVFHNVQFDLSTGFRQNSALAA